MVATSLITRVRDDLAVVTIRIISLHWAFELARPRDSADDRWSPTGQGRRATTDRMDLRKWSGSSRRRALIPDRLDVERASYRCEAAVSFRVLPP